MDALPSLLLLASPAPLSCLSTRMHGPLYVKGRLLQHLTQDAPMEYWCLTEPPIVLPRYRVVVSYPPQSEAELELKEGDIVFVHRKREDGWFKGTLQRNGRTGLFPGSFVDII